MASYFDAWSLLDKAEPIADVVYSSDTREGGRIPLPLVSRYYAGMKYHHTFEWDVPRTEQRRFYVYAELFPPNSDTKTDWYFTAWSQVCETPPTRGSEHNPEKPYEDFGDKVKR